MWSIMVPLNPEFELARFYCLYSFFYFFIYFNILVTDHVNRRCGKNNGRDTGRHWISKSMYNYPDAREQSCSARSRHWRWTSAGLVQKSFSLSTNFFFIYCQKLKSLAFQCRQLRLITLSLLLSVTILYLTLKQVNILTVGKREEKNKDRVYKETTITVTKRLTALCSSLPHLPISHLHFL